MQPRISGYWFRTCAFSILIDAAESQLLKVISFLRELGPNVGVHFRLISGYTATIRGVMLQIMEVYHHDYTNLFQITTV